VVKMSDLRQKVFCIFVRPYYLNSTGNKVYYTGGIFGPTIPDGDGSRYPLTTSSATVPGAVPTSEEPENYNQAFSSDAWFQHSSYISYPAMASALKAIVAQYGTSNIRVMRYVPIDFDVLPNQ
jgi:hypothetical protein